MGEMGDVGDRGRCGEDGRNVHGVTCVERLFGNSHPSVTTRQLYILRLTI